MSTTAFGIPKRIPTPQPVNGIRYLINRKPPRNHVGQSTRHHHHSQTCHKGRNPKVSNHRTGKRTQYSTRTNRKHRRHNHSKDSRIGPSHPFANNPTANDRGKCNQTSHGQINSRGNDHKRHTNCYNCNHCDLIRHIEQVRAFQEVGPTITFGTYYFNLAHPRNTFFIFATKGKSAKDCSQANKATITFLSSACRKALPRSIGLPAIAASTFHPASVNCSSK